MAHTCKKCGQEKSEDQMAKYAGELTETCKECRFSRSKGGSQARKAKSAPARKSKPTELELTLHPGGFGVNARITEEGYLQLTQENQEAPADNICLTRHEAKQLFDKFGEWIVEEAA